MNARLFIGAGAVLIAAGGVAHPEPVANGLEAQARQLIKTHCTICHSADLITQQRLDRPRWQAIVTKMVSWGAPLTAAEAEDVIRYLAETYPE